MCVMTFYIMLLAKYTLVSQCFIMLDKPLCNVADFFKLNMEVYMHFVTPQICNRQFLLSVTVCLDRMSKRTFLATLILLWITQIS